MQIHSVGIDLGKTTFHLVALGQLAEGSFDTDGTFSVSCDCPPYQEGSQ
jgi:hypothetical protein